MERVAIEYWLVAMDLIMDMNPRSALSKEENPPWDSMRILPLFVLNRKPHSFFCPFLVGRARYSRMACLLFIFVESSVSRCGFGRNLKPFVQKPNATGQKKFRRGAGRKS